MYKRLFFASVLLLLSFSVFGAQLSATLQSGNHVKPFYGEDAFVEAYNAAIDGDVITLSPGLFNSVNISKSVSIVGATAFSGDASTRMNTLTVSADNVTLEGLNLKSLTVEACDRLYMSRCFLNGIIDKVIDGKEFHTNTTIVDCMIDSFGAMEFSKKMTLKNCFINYFTDINQENSETIISHCRINIFARIYASISGSGQYQTLVRTVSETYKMPYAIYNNNYLGIICKLTNVPSTYLNVYGPSEFHNNMFMTYYDTESSTTGSCRIDYENQAVNNNNVRELWKSPLAKNGSPSFSVSDFKEYVSDGVTYGPVNHKDKTSIPYVLSSEISNETDTEGLLHVKIKAEIRD